jgi:hypothetical protein
LVAPRLQAVALITARRELFASSTMRELTLV